MDDVPSTWDQEWDSYASHMASRRVHCKDAARNSPVVLQSGELMISQRGGNRQAASDSGILTDVAVVAFLVS